ncbi:MAG TPA: adenosylhomocysteinase [Candidatus Diapherotrites archaeon]|uniref:Adenosylhomocysteinase n=1 Tax=Candidatus Iainarchaeum sp. TaxID=3101447 RepID=A0A7J4JFV5_9ARCH|nr:adenosylhomocysteinase [Candidatus Diapherotrites archaeon]HIH16598.1 adenosylhomocysteinase [Candidatus Diapherotrites archaeon]
MAEAYKVKDLSLAEQGKMNIEFAEGHMQALLEVKKRFAKEKPFKGLTIGMALHVTKETAVLVRTLVAGGAKVAITGCNPLSTQDDVAAALAKEGVNVFAWKGETKQEYYDNLQRVLDFNPDATVDDGCDLISEIHKNRTDLLGKLVVGTEETTTGVNRLKAMEAAKALKYPVIAVNDNRTKHLFDNYYGTGQSTLDGILRATSVMLAGKILVVIGYGECGKGVAARGKGMACEVIVCEVDPVRALQARMDGFRVMPMAEAAKLGDIFVAVTGNKHVISMAHLSAMKEGAIVANSGHFDNEIDMASLNQQAKGKRRVRWQLDEYTLKNGRKVFVCGEGRLVNLAAAEGHPSVVMALSFCGQALALEYGVKKKGKLGPGVHVLPKEIDDAIASLQLKALGVKHDALTKEQHKYMTGWEEGT